MSTPAAVTTAVMPSAPAPVRTQVPPTTQPLRDAAVDAVRLLGVVAIVAAHTWPHSWFRTLVFPWHVPLFFVLAGYFWRPETSWRTDVAKRARSLLRPYAVWLAVMGALAVAVLARQVGVAEAARTVVPVLLRGGAALQQPFNSYWFITALFASAVLYGAACRTGPYARWGVVAVSMLCTELSAPVLARAPLSVGTAVCTLVLVEAGRQVREHEHRLTRPLALAVLAAAAAGTAAGLLPPLDLKQGDFGLPVVSVLAAVAVTASLVVLAKAVPHLWAGRRGRVVTALAAAAVPVVLLHPLALVVPVPPSLEPLRFAAALLAPMGLALLLARTRWSSWCLGR